jgi:hypothetical protein
VWDRDLAPLNQWFTSSCTGHAAVGLLATEPNRSRLPANTVLNKDLAMKIYGLATKKDNFGWTYPPTDKGSSVLAAMKACKELGLIAEYRWCATPDDVFMALSHVGPVVIGVDWYEGFNRPACDGLITISGKRTGGHAVHLYGIDVDKREVWGFNSYGYLWGNGGKFRMSFDDVAYLLNRGGDAVMAVL